MGKFKMKGPSLYPKLKLNRGGYSNRDDGRSKSSAFQDKDDKKKVDKKKVEGESEVDPNAYEKILIKEQEAGKEHSPAKKKIIAKYRERLYKGKVKKP